jgi:MFS family permease
MFYGWKIVAALFVVLMFSSGLGFYNHSVVLQALASEKGFPITVASTAVSIFFFSSGIAGLYIASLLERYDVRLIMGVGTVIASLCLGGLGEVSSQGQLYLLYCLFGVGFCASGLLPATTLVARWFHKSRARALSIASTGLSVGGIMVTPASATLIESQGMVVASPILGLAYLLGVLPLSLLILRSRPQELGLDAEGTDRQSPLNLGGQGLLLKQALSDIYFWRLNLAYVFVMMAQVGGIAHQYGLVSEQLSGREAALALGVLPLFSIIGRLAGGLLVDKLNATRFTVVMMLLQGLSLACMGYFTSPAGLLIGLALFGITVGNLLMLQPLLIAERYGLLQYSRIYAVSNLLTMMGIATGPAAMGYLFVFSGTYGLAYLAAAAMGLVAFMIFLGNSRSAPLDGALIR